MSLSLPQPQQPAFDCFVQIIAHVKTPDYLPGSPQEVVAANVYHVTNKGKLIELLMEQMQTIAAQGGIMVPRPDNPKIVTAEHIISPEFKLFVPMWNITYIEIKTQIMTELPRIEEPGIPLIGQGVETKELKPI